MINNKATSCQKDKVIKHVEDSTASHIVLRYERN
jgi:hypothetical protein